MSNPPISESHAMELLAEAFAEPLDSLSPTTSRDSLAGWDSMGALALMAMLDEKFSVELTPDESIAMTKVSDALQFMRSKGVIAP